MRLVARYLIIIVSALLVAAFMSSFFFFNQRPSFLATFLKKIPMRSNDFKIYTKLRTNISCPSKVRLLIVVSSNLGHFDRRALIRSTWGQDYSSTLNWKTVFLLSDNDNQRDKKLGQTEEETYGDVITGSYKEAFFNMAFKVAMGFEWALKFCEFDFLLKTDDDVFVNTHGLLEYLNRWSTPRQKLYTGNAMVGSPVLRDHGRYAVKYVSGEERDDEINKTMYAPYCSGGGFLLSADVVSTLFNLYDLEHPLNIDDAYIGELAERAHIKLLVNKNNFFMYADDCKYHTEAYVQHPAKGKCLEDLYRQHINFTMSRTEDFASLFPPQITIVVVVMIILAIIIIIIILTLKVRMLNKTHTGELQIKH